MNETANDRASTPRAFRPKLAFYKANAKGSGRAMKMELHPAHGQTDGSIMVTLANQMTIGDRRGPNPTFPHFDWENAICVKLDFSDLSKMLQVFRGECESIEEGRGLVHRSPKGLTYIKLAHQVDPIPGYTLEVKRCAGEGRHDQRAFMPIAPYEALGLTAAIEDSLGVICFGMPMVIERDTSAYRQAVKEQRDASAA